MWDTKCTWTASHLQDYLVVLCTQAVKYCGTVKTNKTGMSLSLREKTKLKYVDIRIRMKGNLRAKVWTNKT